MTAWASIRRPPGSGPVTSGSRPWRRGPAPWAGRCWWAPPPAGARPSGRRCRLTAEVRVVIVDDHPVVRQGLRTFLAVQEGIDVVGEAGDGAEAVAMVRTLTPDVVLLDLVMPGLDGVAAIARLTAEIPGTKVLVLTSFPDDDKLLAAVQAGAAGYLLKDVAPAELANAVRAVARGEAALSSRPAARLLREYTQGGSAAGPVALTGREREVLGLVG